jgi:putative zinc finger protein
MKCEDCQIIIEDYADGVLGEREAEKIGTHLRECAKCAEAYALFQREQSIYARYERDLEVTPDLWAGVEARIKRERIVAPGLLTRLRQDLVDALRAPRLSPGLAAALILIAIGVTIGLMNLKSKRPEPPVPQISQTDSKPGPSDNTGSPSGESNTQSQAGPIAKQQEPLEPTTQPPARRVQRVSATPTAAQLIREAEQKYVAAIAILSKDLDRRRAKLDPVVVAQLDAALANIDSTIRETQRVVRENPQDPTALQYLLAAYAKKVDALREMSRD